MFWINENVCNERGVKQPITYNNNNNNNNNNRVDLMVGDKTKNKARYEMNNADSTEIY